MISRQTGTKVPRSDSATNSSKDVCFMASTCGSPGLRPSRSSRRTEKLHRCTLHHNARGALARPPFELPARLADQHLESADRLGPRRTRGLEQARLRGVVDEVVHELPVERSGVLE